MIRIAIAINESQEIQNEHFGEAYEFKLFDLKAHAVIPQISIENPARNIDEHTHGNANKGKQIVKLLSENKVEAVVSQEFGKNIKIINQNFVPIITKNSTIEKTLSDLRGLIDEIKEAYAQNPKSLVRIQ
ncbi:MAG: hypothetical protein C0599_01020 [Salinivirgaceae bacterium]|nr:MAG: hypothetical protein C0599_01020 [Salinivirgaceae bacterium]